MPVVRRRSLIRAAPWKRIILVLFWALLCALCFDHHPFGRRLPKQAVWRHRGFEVAFRRLLFAVELDGIAELVSETGCGKSAQHRQNFPGSNDRSRD